LPGLGIEPRTADNRFRLSVHCANEPQRLFAVCADVARGGAASNGSPVTPKRKKRLIFEKDTLHRGGQARLKFV